MVGAKDMNVLSLSDCHFGCMMRSWCAGYNFHKQLQYCLVFGSFSGITQPDPYFITGSKTCGNSGSESKRDYQPMLWLLRTNL